VAVFSPIPGSRFNSCINLSRGCWGFGSFTFCFP